MFCSSCGHAIASGSRFCAGCGAMSASATTRVPAQPGFPPATNRGVLFVVLMTVLTCGLYLVRWYFAVLGELDRAGRSPMGHSRWVDFLLCIVTLGLWGLFVDYRIAKTIAQLQEERHVTRPNDTSTIVLLLDLFGVGLIGSALQQSEINRLWKEGRW